jgi:8-oxo-dGTP diphosphatase
LEDFYKEGVINKMINTTLCYIERDNKYLMLHRTKKENDLNEGKWIGVGGKFEKDETQ